MSSPLSYLESATWKDILHWNFLLSFRLKLLWCLCCLGPLVVKSPCLQSLIQASDTLTDIHTVFEEEKEVGGGAPVTQDYTSVLFCSPVLPLLENKRSKNSKSRQSEQQTTPSYTNIYSQQNVSNKTQKYLVTKVLLFKTTGHHGRGQTYRSLLFYVFNQQLTRSETDRTRVRQSFL